MHSVHAAHSSSAPRVAGSQQIFDLNELLQQIHPFCICTRSLQLQQRVTLELLVVRFNNSDGHLGNTYTLGLLSPPSTKLVFLTKLLK
jgi:hypothetical protein